MEPPHAPPHHHTVEGGRDGPHRLGNNAFHTPSGGRGGGVPPGQSRDSRARAARTRPRAQKASGDNTCSPLRARSRAVPPFQPPPRSQRHGTSASQSTAHTRARSPVHYHPSHIRGSSHTLPPEWRHSTGVGRGHITTSTGAATEGGPPIHPPAAPTAHISNTTHRELSTSSTRHTGRVRAPQTVNEPEPIMSVAYFTTVRDPPTTRGTGQGGGVHATPSLPPRPTGATLSKTPPG
ncbi:unnamed protein product [Dicrocoelium dendriticum]|nr:unnamed protein product [Dicrocoelium dendriticum]